MGLKPYDRKISQIFNNVEYDVDFYQREYKWNDSLEHKPVSALLRDIFYRFDLEKYNPNTDVTAESIEKIEWYYLNSFMTHTSGGRRYIVDGQQRLTTLTLISIALYHLATKFSLPDHVCATLRGSVEGTTEFGATYWMGFKDRRDALHDILINDLVFQRQPANASETNIYENYAVVRRALEKKLATDHKLLTFISYFRNRVYLIEIEVEDNKDVAMVFEVINDRGVPLKPYEILKGKILSTIDISDRGRYVGIWETALASVEEYGEAQIDEFFSFYFRGKYADSSEQYRRLESTRYHKTIFLDEFDSRIGLRNNEKNCREFVEKRLPYFANLYRTILDYYNEYDEEYEYVYFNQLNNIDGQFPLIMAAVELNDSSQDQKIKEISRVFDRYYVGLRLTGSYRSNDFGASVISLCPRVRDKSSKEVAGLIDEQLVVEVQNAHALKQMASAFQYEFFRNSGYNDLGAGFLRYFFARVDHYISRESDLPPFGSYRQLVQQTRGNDVYHVEHVLVATRSVRTPRI